MTNLVTLEQVKTYLRYPNPSGSDPDDTALQWFINAADEVLRFECEEILPTLYDEHYDGGDITIHLRHIPVLEIVNVEEGWGWLNYELDFVEVNSPSANFSLYAYSLDSAENGEVSRRSAGNVTIPFHPGEDNIHVQYRAGLNSIPGTVVLAELQLVGHWWKNTQYRATALAGTNVAYDAVAGQVYTRDTESGDQNINIGVPFEILELVKTRRHRPIIA